MLHRTFFLVLAGLAAPAMATSYSARLAAPADSRVIARDINWSCSGQTCQGATSESRPAVLCQALAKRAGKVESFLVDGRAMSEAELVKCNAAVRRDASKALAAQ